MQLFKLQEGDNPGLNAWLKRGTDTYLTLGIQNEMLEMMLLSMLHSIVQKLHSADAFTIMPDECTNISNNGQLVIRFHLVDIDNEVHEEFVGLY